MVMLKLDPKFKLDRNFRGPYRVHGVTSTTARIQLINNPDAEVVCVSLQHLSRCTGLNLDLVKPCMEELEDNEVYDEM